MAHGIYSPKNKVYIAMKKYNAWEADAKYNAWKADAKSNPIEGTDKIFLAKTKRAVLRHIAYEEGVDYQHNDVCVRCKDGTTWCVKKI